MLQFSFPEIYNRGGVIFFHDGVIIVLVLILTLVGYGIIWIITRKLSSRVFESQALELWWTIIPAVILFVLGFFSLRLLYLLEDLGEPSLTVKAIGHQWYWSYEYNDYKSIRFDSYIVPSNEISIGDLRLLEVDNRVLLPTNTNIRIVVTAADVIHSWALPGLRIKVDAVPGRLNQIPAYCLYPSIIYGQCSEICGANHSFIPIVVEFVPTKNFFEWIKLNSSL